MYSIKILDVKLKTISLNMYEVYLAATILKNAQFGKAALIEILSKGGWILESQGSTYLSRTVAIKHIDHTLAELVNDGILVRHS